MHFPDPGRRPSQPSAERIETKERVPQSPGSGSGEGSPTAGVPHPSFASLRESGGADSPTGRDGKSLTERVPSLPASPVLPAGQASPGTGGSAFPVDNPPPDLPPAELPAGQGPAFPELALELPEGGPVHGELADVVADGQVLHAGARIVEGNQGLVIVAAGDEAPGIFAGAVFASTLIVLRSEAAIGVSHDFTDPDNLQERLLECIDVFEQSTGQVPSVTLAWNRAGQEERARAALEGPVDDQELAEMNADEREAHVQLTVAAHEDALVTLANSLEAELNPSVVDLPSAALFVPVEGALDVFEGRPDVQAQWQG